MRTERKNPSRYKIFLTRWYFLRQSLVQLIQIPWRADDNFQQCNM